VFIEGGIYHVYNRLVRGERLFEDEEVAGSFLSLVRRVRDRDDLTIFGWCVMPNHYHLAVRAGPVRLSRSFGTVQSVFGRSYNSLRGSSGPRWQSRYQAKLVEDARYLRQLILYIHLNPVSAGVVKDPRDYRLSGHRELLGETIDPLGAVDDVLGMFGSSLEESRRSYLDALAAAAAVDWVCEFPGRLPWWRREPDRPIEAPGPTAWIDERGVTTGRQRPNVSAGRFLAAACRLLGLPIGCLAGSGRRHEICRMRWLVAGLAIERWGVSAKELAAELGRWPDVVGRWARRAGHLRLADREFRQAYEDLDDQLAQMFASSEILPAGNRSEATDRHREAVDRRSKRFRSIRGVAKAPGG
jgi:REP element-mobilizing transposase RayT